MTQLPARAAPRVPLLAAIGVAWLCTAATPLPDRGTPADQDACTPDVFRLCSGFIPDEPQILACLMSKRAELSPACGKVLAPAPDKKHPRRAGKSPT